MCIASCLPGLTLFFAGWTCYTKGHVLLISINFYSNGLQSDKNLSIVIVNPGEIAYTYMHLFLRNEKTEEINYWST